MSCVPYWRATTSRIRVDTVHQAKGESLDAVLYLATKEHVSALLAGMDSELGRIGYVAATRARNLLRVGVPANALAELRPECSNTDFKKPALQLQLLSQPEL